MYETQNKKIIRHLAKADLKSKKMGNNFIMITIMLAACLIMFMGLMPGAIKLDLQRQLAQAQDVIYHNVTSEQIAALKQDDRVSFLTLDKQGEQMEIDDYVIWQVYYDGSAETIKTLELVEGRLPERKNEVLVSKAYMKKIGQKARVGAKITVPFLSGETESCIVSGFTKDIKNSQLYPIIHSQEYAEKGKALKDVNYDALVKIADSKDMVEDEFLRILRDVGKKAGVPRSQINENNHYLDTLSPGKITGDTVTIAVIGAVILIAGIMVIYSVFYISVTGKIQEYGQLRTLGMTRKQVRRLVRKEGVILALRAAPVGVALGAGVSAIARPGGFSLVNDLILAAFVVAAVLLTVLLSVMKPAKIAASVSPIEAVRYSAYAGGGEAKASRKPQRKITPFSMARMNSARNRKKTFMTMLSLGMGGILFMGAVTFAVSADGEKYAQVGEFQMGQFQLRFSGNAEETAEHGKAQLQLSNPFTDDFQAELQSLPGVRNVYALEHTSITYDYREQTGEEDVIMPFTKAEVPAIKKAVQEGSLDYDQLLQGDKIIVYGNDQYEGIYGYRFHVGDQVTIHYYDGQEKEKTYEIAAAIDDYKEDLIYGWFLLPEEVLKKELPGVNLRDEFVVNADPEMTDQIEASLREIVDQQPRLTLKTLRQVQAEGQEIVNQMVLLIVILVLFVTLFSLINLINTLITNFLSQRMELAMLQSIGMTSSQISKMIMGEGLILAAGNVLISLVFGSLVGYGICQFMRNLGAHYVEYQFPLLYSLLYVAVVALIPCVIGFLMIRNFRNQSLVDRLRQ